MTRGSPMGSRRRLMRFLPSSSPAATRVEASALYRSSHATRIVPLQSEEQIFSISFGAQSTTDEVHLVAVDLAGKRVLVTGVSSGLGVETARALAARGAHVVGAARDLVKAEAATSEAREAAAAAGGALELVPLDLADLPSVRAA